MRKQDKDILRLAVPSIVSNVTVPLLGLADVAIVGHIGNERYIGAIAIGSMIFNVIYWVFGFLRMGTSGMTSQALGRRDLKGVMRLLQQSLTVGLSVALIFVLFQTPLCRLSLWLMRTPDDVMSPVIRYFRIVIWGAPAMLSLYGLTGWYVGMQNTRIPMFIAVFQNIVNICSSFALVFLFDMQIEGVACGTLLAQWAGWLLAVGLWLHYYGRLKDYTSWDGVFSRSALSRFFTVNRDIFLRTLCLVAVNLFFTSAGAAQGAMVLAANTLLMQFFMLFSYVLDGFAFAGEALTGKAFGAGNRRALETTVNRLFVFGIGVTVTYACVYALTGHTLLSLLTSDATVVSVARNYLPWVWLVPVTGVSAFVYDGVFIGMTATRGMLVSSAVAACLFFVTFFSLHGAFHNHALWLAFNVFLGVRGTVQWWLYRQRKKMSSVNLTV